MDPRTCSICNMYMYILYYDEFTDVNKHARVVFEMPYCKDNHLLFLKKLTISSEDILLKGKGKYFQCKSSLTLYT